MKKIILLVLIITSVINVNAQNESSKWAVGLGINAINFSGPITKEYFQLDEFRGSHKVFLGRYLNPSFNFKSDLSFGKIWFPTVTAYPDVLEGIYENRHFYDLGFNIEYKLNNGYILEENARVSPYLFTGFGLNSVIDYGAKDNDGSDINTFVPFGLGLNVRFVDWLSLNLQSAYKINIDNSYDNTHHSASLVFSFGGSPKGGEAKEVKSDVIDSDKDGVADLVDECPFAAGSATFHGCPDTDGDGIGDSRDDCPKVAGFVMNKGCPSKDTDGDGVSDDKDSCPNVKGEKRYAGCPDSDGDGIVDKYDNCPNKKGSASNNGCPKKQETFGNTENKTNISTTTSTSTVNSTSTNTGNVIKQFVIYFGTSSDYILKSERAKLAKALSFLNSNQGYRAYIKGHADVRGNDIDNLGLSLKRATTVWQYLTKLGLSADKVDLYGYGEYEQKMNSNTRNRKVVIEIVK